MRKFVKPISVDPLDIILLLMAFIIGSSELAWVVKLNYLLMMVILIIIGAILYIFLNKKYNFRIHFKGFGFKSMLHLIGLLLIIIISFAPFGLAVHRDHNSSGLLGIELYGFDDNVHLSLVKNIAEHHGLIYEKATKQQTVEETGVAGYPQGWHVISSLVYSGFLQVNNFILKLKYPSNTIAAYIVSKVVWYILLCVLIYYAILKTFRRFMSAKLNKGQDATAVLLAVFSVGLIEVVILFEMVTDGFDPFIGSLVALVLLLNYGLDSLYDGLSKKSFILMLLCILCLSATWILTLLVGLLIIVFCFLQQEGVKDLGSLMVKIKGLFSRRPVLMSTLISLIVVLTVFFPIAQTVYGPSVGSLLNNSGGISPVNTTLILFLLLFIGLIAAYYRSNQGLKIKGLNLFLAPALLWAFVGCYEVVTSGSFSYYYDKTGDILVITLLMLLLCLIISTIIQTNLKRSIMELFAVSIVFVSVAIMLFPANFTLLREYTQAYPVINKFTNNNDRQELINVIRKAGNGNIVSFFMNSVEDSNFNHFLAGLNNTKNEYQDILAAIPSQTNSQQFVSNLVSYVNTSSAKKIYIVGDQSSIQTLAVLLPHSVLSRIVFEI